MRYEELVVPRLGESITEVTIIKWVKKIGDFVKKDEVLLRIATDKVDSEIISPYDGILQNIFYAENEIVSVDAVLAIIAKSDKIAFDSLEKKVELNRNAVFEVQFAKNITKCVSEKFENKTPVAKNYIFLNNIPNAMLPMVMPKNKNNRLYKKDLELFMSQVPKIDHCNISSKKIFLNPNKILKNDTDDTLIELSRSRNVISKKMQESKSTIPHVTSVIEADVTDMVKWRECNKERFVQEYKIKITYTSFFIKAITNALIIKPQLNAFFIDDKIILKKKINIGFAVSTKIGDLIVPVIKNTAGKSLLDIAKDLSDLKQKALEGRLSVDEICEATYTISNIGTFNNIIGTPLVSIPQVGVMAIGAIIKRPMVVNDKILIRDMVYLSHSYDHRIIDGQLGGEFAFIVSQELKNLDLGNF